MKVSTLLHTMSIPPLSASHEDLLDYYVGEEYASQVKDTFQLIPYMFSRQIIRRVMSLVLKDKPRNTFLIDISLPEVLQAYHWVLQNATDDHEDQHFYRTGELDIYQQAASTVLPFANRDNAMTAALDCRERIQRLQPPPMLLCDTTANNINPVAQPCTSQANVLHKEDNDIKQAPQSCLSPAYAKAKHVHEERATSKHTIFTEEEREQILAKFTKNGKKVDPSVFISNNDLYFLDRPTEAVNGYVQVSPRYMERVLWFTNFTIIDAIKMVAVEANFPQFDSDHRDDSQEIFQKLQNESLDALYSLYRCSAHSGTDDLNKDPTHECLYCDALGHFTVHCMRYMTREGRLAVLLYFGICNQCGEKDCETYNNHKLFTLTKGCPNCRSGGGPDAKNHLSHLCSCPNRWMNGSYVNGEHDLYQYTRDMSMLARATKFWTDEDWQLIHMSVRDECFRHFKTAMNVDFYYYLFDEEQKEAVKKQGYCPKIHKPKEHADCGKEERRPESGGGWGIKQPKTTGNGGNSQKSISQPQVYQNATQHATKVLSIDQMAKEEIVPRALFDKMLKFPTSYKNAALYLLVMNSDVRNVIMSNDNSPSPVVIFFSFQPSTYYRALIVLCKTLKGIADHAYFVNMIESVSVQVDNVLSRELHKFSNPVQEQCPFEFLCAIFTSMKATLFMSSYNPRKLFEFTLLKRFKCSEKSCDYEYTGPKHHKQSLFSVKLNQSQKKQDLRKLMLEVLRSTVESGHCDKCRRNTRSLKTAIESSADNFVLFVQREVMEEPDRKRIFDVQIKLESCVYEVQNSSGSLEAFQLSAVICREDISNTPSYVYLYRTPGGKWFRMTSQTITRVDPDDTAKFAGSNGIVFHLRSISRNSS